MTAAAAPTTGPTTTIEPSIDSCDRAVVARYPAARGEFPRGEPGRRWALPDGREVARCRRRPGRGPRDGLCGDRGFLLTIVEPEPEPEDHAVSTALSVTSPPTPTPTPIDPAILEMVVAGGDLSRLSPAQRTAWYRARCEAAGLDPRTQPFQYLSLQGKLTLYATKAATDQLIATHKLTVEILDREVDREAGISVVRCRATFPDGHSVEDIGALSIAGLKGEPLCNALMKVITKSKRRTVLSACGLGMLDETEVDSIPDARRVDPAKSYQGDPPPRTVGLPPGGSPAGDRACLDWANAYVAQTNLRWLDRNPGRDGLKELVSFHQLMGHLYKTVGGGSERDGVIPNHRNRAVAVAFAKDPAAVRAEAKSYVLGLMQSASAELEAVPGGRTPPPDDDEESDPGEWSDQDQDAREPGEEG